MNDSDKKAVPETPQHADGEQTVKDSPEVSAGEKRKRHLIKPTWLRILLKTLMWIIIVVLLIPVLLYVPPVQTFVKNVACNMVRKSTGMDISIDKFRLKWPVDISLKGVSVVEASGDTMVYAKEVIADVKLRPLLKLDFDINKLQLIDGGYRMVSPDSSMILKLKAGLLEVDDKSSANMATSEILLNKATLKDGNVSLFMDVWKKQQSQDTTSTPFLIKANDVRLENFTFAMSMLPTIDTLTLRAGSLALRNGVIDLGKNSITADYLGAADGDAVYLTPTPEYIASHPAPATDSTAVASPPMIIRGDTVELDRFKALYAVKDAKPLPGFDPSYISVTDVNITLSDFYNAASTVELPITRISAKERSGLAITEGHGTIGVDSTGLALKSVEMKTLYSSLSATAGIPFALMQLAPSAPLKADLSGSIGFPDIEAFMPDLKTYTSKLPRRSPLNVAVSADGTLADVTIPVFDVAVPGVFSLNATGRAANALDFKKLRANLTFDGSLSDPSIVKAFVGDLGFKVPTMKIEGTASADAQTYAADFSLLTSAGDVAADGKVSMTSERYDADITLRNVNVAQFAPGVGVGLVSGRISAIGAGFNPTLTHAATDVRVDITSLVYQKKTLHDIIADVTLHNGAFTVNALSKNPGAELRLDGHGTVAPDYYTFDLVSRIDDLDLHSLGLSEEANHGKGEIFLTGSASPDKWLYDADLRLENFEWTAGNQLFALPGELTASFTSTLDNVTADIDALLTSVRFNSATGLKNLIDSFTIASDSVMKQIDRRDLNVELLQKTLPAFTLDVNASGKGVVGKYFNTTGMSMDTLYAHVSNDSLIRMNAGAIEISNASMRADTITLSMLQRGSLLDYKAHMGNRANNPIGEFADVNLNGYLGSNRLLLSLSQKNQKGETGYRLGMTGAFTDSIVSVHFTPLKATIAYLPWQFNAENHIDLNILTKHIDANLMAESNESSILLKTQTGQNGNDEIHLALDNIKVQDFLRMSVFAPPLTASINADLNVGYTNQWFYGNGTIGIKGFTYDKIKVGDFDLGLKAGHNTDGSTGALASLKIDGADALVAKMMLRPDSTGAIVPKKLGIELTEFPLKVANAFLGKDVASLSGRLNGAIDMKGTFTKPMFFGSIACDSVAVYIPMMASSLKFGNDSVSVRDNVVVFDNFDIRGQNANPLVINGSVDASNFSNILFNLQANASNFQLIGNDKKSKGDIYGKVFLNLTAGVTGPMAHMNVNANVDVLSKTDVTYSVPQTTMELSQQDASGVVKFVNFNDTTQMATADSVTSPLAMRIVAGLTIQPGTQVQVEIPGTATTGNGKVEISPSGTLNYFQNYMGDMRLNGQLNIGKGYARYSVPVVGEKKFTFDPESYVHWNGDIMNPHLSIVATDETRTNLIEGGNSRLVNFLVKLSVTNTLSAPKVLFDLSTNDDMSIENELLSMSADQRSMAAINLLLTGQYSGAGVKTASSDMLQGALYGMLTSQLNSWMANHVKGVDLSFGVNQYDKTVNGETGSTTSYSYQMSKSLFDNRFKISVGGNYSTDASADENFSENLINDIAFEYILKQTNSMTMYARLFRHTGYESILEGEITETGVGFVMKRRLATLRRLFRFGRRRKADDQAPEDSVPKETPAFPAPSPRTTLDSLPSNSDK